MGTPPNKMSLPPCGYYEKRFGGGKFSKNGLPDMHVVVCGKSVEVEVKGPNGTPSELQKFMVNQILDSGGIAMILYPSEFDDFKKLIYQLKGGKNAIITQ